MSNHDAHALHLDEYDLVDAPEVEHCDKPECMDNRAFADGAERTIEKLTAELREIRLSLVHARAVYLGSGHSEFPCGLDGGAPTRVAAHDDEITCDACAKDAATRRAHGIPEPTFDGAKLLRDALAKSDEDARGLR